MVNMIKETVTVNDVICRLNKLGVSDMAFNRCRSRIPGFPKTKRPGLFEKQEIDDWFLSNDAQPTRSGFMILLNICKQE